MTRSLTISTTLALALAAPAFAAPPAGAGGGSAGGSAGTPAATPPAPVTVEVAIGAKACRGSFNAWTEACYNQQVTKAGAAAPTSLCEAVEGEVKTLVAGGKPACVCKVAANVYSYADQVCEDKATAEAHDKAARDAAVMASVPGRVKKLEEGQVALRADVDTLKTDSTARDARIEALEGRVTAVEGGQVEILESLGETDKWLDEVDNRGMCATYALGGSLPESFFGIVLEQETGTVAVYDAGGEELCHQSFSLVATTGANSRELVEHRLRIERLEDGMTALTDWADSRLGLAYVYAGIEGASIAGNGSFGVRGGVGVDTKFLSAGGYGAGHMTADSGRAVSGGLELMLHPFEKASWLDFGGRGGFALIGTGIQTGAPASRNVSGSEWAFQIGASPETAPVRFLLHAGQVTGKEFEDGVSVGTGPVKETVVGATFALSFGGHRTPPTFTPFSSAQ